MSRFPGNYIPGDGLISQSEFLRQVRLTEFPTVTQVRKKRKITYYDIPAGFDIETSSFYIGDKKQVIMYEWTFGLYNMITYGRSWDELRGFLTMLSMILNLGTTRLIVYVHNLPYEWQFMRKHFKWDDVFLMEDRSPLYAVQDGFEFRDSLKLTNKSLAKSADDLLKYPCKKMVGDLDYSLIRTPKTEIQSTELKYCENDVRIILHLIQEKIEQEHEEGGSVATIPYTLTGYVRRKCRSNMFPDSEEFSDWNTESQAYEIDEGELNERIRVIKRWISRGIYSR